MGCKVVVVSDHQSINNETTDLTRNNTSAYGRLILTHKASCYHRVVAYPITADHQIVSIFFLEKTINVETNIVCSGKNYYRSPSAAIIPTIIFFHSETGNEGTVGANVIIGISVGSGISTIVIVIMLVIIIAIKWKTICHGTQDMTLDGIIKIIFKIMRIH